MTTVFHPWLCGRFIAIQSNLRRPKLHRRNQDSNFLWGSFSNKDNVWASIQFRRESQPQHLKRWISSRTDPSIFTSIAPVLLGQSNETSWDFQHWNQQAPSYPSQQCLVDQIVALPFLIYWNEKQCSKSNILTMDHKLILVNSISAIYALLNTIIYLKVKRYLNIRLRQIY